MLGFGVLLRLVGVVSGLGWWVSVSGCLWFVGLVFATGGCAFGLLLVWFVDLGFWLVWG